ncbi:MAG TPA: hypothetical protein VMU63_04285 [Acidimicrobiales bacterium]|nr:hypothetical protein [Acidimicrobiales bacterium]
MVPVHTVTLPTRTTQPGSTLDLMVLADGPEGCAAVDVRSGSLVRASYPGRPDRPLAAFDLIRVVLAEDPDGPDPTQPEGVSLVATPQVLGRVRRRRVRRLLEPLTLPAGAEPFGFPGSATPYWLVPGDRPSLAVLRPQSGPQLKRYRDGLFCRFGWRGVEVELPLVDRAARRLATAADTPRLSGGQLAGTLGFMPSHLVLALTTPHEGRCYKVVAGLLPAP